jgi:hypothetical protein
MICTLTAMHQSADFSFNPLEMIPLSIPKASYFILAALQRYVAEQDVEECIFILSSYICFGCMIYIAILSAFRVIFFENDSLFKSFLQIFFCAALLVAIWFTDRLPRFIDTFAQIGLSSTAVYFCDYLHCCYVCGVKHNPTNLDCKVYIITGATSGKG